MALTLEEKRVIIGQRIGQAERELYINELNLKLYTATNADLNQLTFINNEIEKQRAILVVLEQEANSLA